ncbi:pantetheine-phosphate adenylyltransferase [Ameyamaea chiangmaiensis NBRC 103196]|uniref:Phosphopantetheine adenylyltransferase n=1 Tax=Ameyamaea chiangmaiensis TaxID=442969 RepID=A0A850PG27_9PROT|nr:pantetheine-phosphate adenylyltransferase [Ameyamaea chiangmaiensis]MBS4074844.1 pantetheine-phosphate adenylyltransferase [Ameyamaea chiangmaiensis]NVN41793.1 pantetheine-phosphate adenylyltransferase [Ameyamaea chiangmaiensis]GBQ62951.1 pantetheine-phosphate adenylyltransferase [Ameyamaea chiangmaiensis NBRC 103196]
MAEAVERAGFYPGTFDPVTLGHMDIIERASAMLDRLVVGVATGATKTPLLDLTTRIECIEAAVVPLLARGRRIEVIAFDTLLVSAARAQGAQVIVRGLRAVTDFDYEAQMTGLNREMAPDLDTIFLMATEKRRCVAASRVREIARLGGDITPFVPDHARRMVLARLAGA